MREWSVIPRYVKNRLTFSGCYGDLVCYGGLGHYGGTNVLLFCAGPSTFAKSGRSRGSPMYCSFMQAPAHLLKVVDPGVVQCIALSCRPQHIY